MTKRKLPQLGALLPSGKVRVEIQPGTWEEINPQEIVNLPLAEFEWPDTKKAYERAKPTVSDSLVNQYLFFQEHFGVPNKVLYPSCDLDISPIRGFPNSKVTLLDINPDAVNALKRHGVFAIQSDISEYKPEELFDLLILLNPGYETSRAIHTLRQGGIIMANNYHGNTRQMLDSPDIYEFVSGIENVGKESFHLADRKGSLELLARSPDYAWIFRKK